MAIKRQQIIDYIKTQLATITVANGYYTNLGSNVFEWKATPFENAEIPGLEIRDGEENVADVTTEGNYNLHTNVIEIEIKVVCSESTPAATVRKMIIDVYKLIGANLKWNDYALYTYCVGNKIDVDQQGKFIGSAGINIQIYYRTTAWSET